MKKLVGLVLILAVLILGGYYGMGLLTERTIKSNIEVINQTNGLYAQIEQYQRGWFSSNAKIKWRIHLPERVITENDGVTRTIAAEDQELSTPIHICHGPIIFCHHKLRFGMGYAQTHIALPPQYTKQFDEQFAQGSIKPHFDLSIFINYFLESSISLSIPEFKLIDKSGAGTFSSKSLITQIAISSDKNHIDGDVAVNDVVFSKEQLKATLNKATMAYDMHQTKAGLYLGAVHLDIPSFDIIDNNNTLVHINAFNMNSDSNIDDELFSTHFNLNVASIVANKRTYGPGAFAISLKNLDAGVLAKMNQQTILMQNGTDAQRQQAILSMLPELPQLFNKGAELEISKCTLTLPEGLVDGTLLVSLPKSDNANPFELLPKIQGHAQLKAPAALVKQLIQQAVMQQLVTQPEMQQALAQQVQSPTPNQVSLSNEQIAALQADKQINAMKDKGLIIASANEYSIDVTLHEGKFIINGKPLDPSMLVF